jgi:hypothetical protein
MPRMRPAPSPKPTGPPAVRLPARVARPRLRIAHIVEASQPSLLDVIDNLLNKGVVLNADLILALADVDLVYVRLSALVCAADRIVPRGRRRRA